MEAFSTLLALCVGNSLVTGEFPTQRPMAQSFDVFFDLCLNKQLSKQSWGWWFEMYCAHYDVTVILKDKEVLVLYEEGLQLPTYIFTFPEINSA